MCFYQLMCFSHLLCLARAAVWLATLLFPVKIWALACLSRERHVAKGEHAPTSLFFFKALQHVLFNITTTKNPVVELDVIYVSIIKKSVAFYKGNCWSCLHMSCLYSCIVVDGHRRVETGNIFKDGDVGGGDTYHVSCEYQLSHVCSVVLTWC